MLLVVPFGSVAAAVSFRMAIEPLEPGGTGVPPKVAPPKVITPEEFSFPPISFQSDVKSPVSSSPELV